MDSPVYRVVLTGELAPGFSREAVIAVLARFFDVSAARLVNLFDGGDSPVGDVLSADQASELQRNFEKLGARARVERVFANDTLPRDALFLPKQANAVDAGLMRCPACGHEQLVAESCDECGVVFAEFNRGQSGSPLPPQTTTKPRQNPPRPKPESPHARDAWQEDWLDDGDGVPTEDYHLGLFMGMRSAYLSEPCKKMTLGRRTRMKLSWVWGAMPSPFLWAMYRKMWLWGAVIFLVEIFVPILLIILGTKEGISDRLTYVGFAMLLLNRLVWPAVLKGLYCRHARRTIAYMHRMSPTYAPDIDIATRGGTSRTSVFVGIVIALVLSLLTWSIADSLHGTFVRPGPVFLEPPALPELIPDAAQPDTPTTTLQDDLLVNENRWVATRNKLRSLGQRVNAWLADDTGNVDPATLDLNDVVRALRLDQDDVLDGWGNRIDYQSDGQGYRLISAGPDGVFGNTDDVDYRRTLRR